MMAKPIRALELHHPMINFLYNASYASPFALGRDKLLLNDKITALCQTNMPTKHFIKHYKQQKWILKNC